MSFYRIRFKEGFGGRWLHDQRFGHRRTYRHGCHLQHLDDPDIVGCWGLLDIYFTVDGVNGAGIGENFVSTFTSNQQNATTHQAQESVWADNGNGKFDAGLVTNLASALLTNSALQVAGPFTTQFTPGSPSSFTELYQIQLVGLSFRTVANTRFPAMVVAGPPMTTVPVPLGSN